MELQTKSVELGSDLDIATEEFLNAGRKYREFLKRHASDRLAASVWVSGPGGEMVLYTETERHSSVIVEAIRGVERRYSGE